MTKNNIYVVDFETTTKSPVKVWLWGIVSVDYTNPINYLTGDNYVYGDNIESFFEYIKTLKNPIIYIHSLKFEDSYIFDYLLKNNYEWIDPDDQPKTCKKKFTCIIGGDNGNHYMTKIIFKKDEKSKKTQKATLINSANLTRSSVLEMAYDLKNNYYIKIKEKSIDFDRHNEDVPIIKEELEYNKIDCLIVAETLQIMQSMGFTLDDKCITIGSQALKLYKSIFNQKKKSKVLFDKLFKNQYTKELDDKFRKAYRGGFNFLNIPSGKIMYNVIAIDKNSMYPHIMATMPLPYGEPIHFKGEYKGHKKDIVYIQYVKIWGRCKDDKIPFLKNKSDDRIEAVNYERNIYMHTWITNIELDYIKKTYDIIKIDYYEGYYFNTSTNLFNSYFISQFYQTKEQSRNTNQTIFRVSKLLLDSLNGKFGTKYKQKSLRPILLNNKIHYKLNIREENGVKYNYRERDILYTPISIFVTAYAKIELLKSAEDIINQFGYDSFIYCDTDSIHFKLPESGELPDNIEISDKMGAWKVESIAYKAKYLGCKRYIFADENNNLIKCVCAGLDKNAQNQITWDNFKPGTIYKNCKKNIIVEGGMIITNNGIFELY